MKLPYDNCIQCKQRDDCPILTSGAQGFLRVPKPDQCIIKQLDSSNLASLATQIENHLGLLEVQREKLGRQLELVLTTMETKGKHIIG